MKKLIVLLALAATGIVTARAQDVIVLKDATEIQAKIANISSSEVTFYKWSNLGGPTYTLKKSDILFIKHENGEKEVFRATDPVYTTTATASAKAGYDNPRAGKCTFQGYFHGIALANGSWAGPAFDLSLGVRIYDYAYVGAEAGFDYLFITSGYAKGREGWYIPVGLNLRGYCPTNGKIYPFGSFTVGCAIGNDAVFHCQCLGGIDIGRLTLAAGWDRILEADSFIFKIGVRFGK